jgi:hypothetical protein
MDNTSPGKMYYNSSIRETNSGGSWVQSQPGFESMSQTTDWWDFQKRFFFLKGRQIWLISENLHNSESIST